MPPSFKYLVYDIETSVDKTLLNRVLYPGEKLSDADAFQKHLAELALENRDFVNPAFHSPICISAVAVADNFSITKIGLLGGDDKTVRSIVQNFWEIYNHQQPVLVDFNGKGFDLRLMELWAFRLGLSIHSRHFAKFGTRYKFNEENHIDLNEFLTNYGAIRYRGGLNLFSKILGKPGKMSTQGDMVQTLFEAGEINRISDYCLCDAMDTYFVFLRTRVMTGELTLEREKQLVAESKLLLEEKNEKEGLFGDYLKNFGEWVPL